MVVWPAEASLNADARDGLRRFQDTSAFAELEESDERWRIVAWPWTSEAPMTVQLENDAHEALDFTVDEDGLWRMSQDPRVVRERTIVELQDDADAFVFGIPPENVEH